MYFKHLALRKKIISDSALSYPSTSLLRFLTEKRSQLKLFPIHVTMKSSNGKIVKKTQTVSIEIYLNELVKKRSALPEGLFGYCRGLGMNGSSKFDLLNQRAAIRIRKAAVLNNISEEREEVELLATKDSMLGAR